MMAWNNYLHCGFFSIEGVHLTTLYSWIFKWEHISHNALHIMITLCALRWGGNISLFLLHLLLSVGLLPSLSVISQLASISSR